MELKTIIKLTFFIITLSLLVACSNETKTESDSNLNAIEEENLVEEENLIEDDPLVYFDEELGFTLHFPENWESHFEVFKFTQEYNYYDDNIRETIVAIPFIYEGINYYEREYGLGHLFEIVVIHEPIEKQDWFENPIVHWDYINCNDKNTYSFRYPHQLPIKLMENETALEFYRKMSEQIEEIINNIEIVNASENNQCSKQNQLDLSRHIAHFVNHFGVDKDRIAEPIILDNEIVLYNTVFPTDIPPNNISNLAIYSMDGDLLYDSQHESIMYVDYIINPIYDYTFVLSSISASGIGYGYIIALNENDQFLPIGEINGYSGTRLNNFTQLHEILANDYNHSHDIPMAGREPISVIYIWDDHLLQYVKKK